MNAVYPYTLAGFKRFCRTLVLENGKPLVLEPHEITALRDYFAGVTETLIIIPKKNGKTTLLAALALFHVLCFPEARCYVGASSRDQATILHEQSAGLVRRSELEDVFQVQPGYRLIKLRSNPESWMRVLAADANTIDGVIPTLALVDELHRHPSGELYGVFRDGLGPRNGRMVTISTAGATTDSPLGKLRAAAYELPGYKRNAAKRYGYAKSPDGSFVMHEWCLEASDDVHDMKVVKKANPASWQTLKALKERHDSPSTTPWQWLRFACGIWTEGEEPWIDPPIWDALANGLRVKAGEKVWAAVDLGVANEPPSILVGASSGSKMVVKADIMPAGSPLQDVEDRLKMLCREFAVEHVGYDPWQFGRSAALLTDEGLPMLEFPETAERMSKASGTLYRLIESGELSHDGDPVFRAHVVAGVVKKTERGWRLSKDPKHSRPVSALMALAMVCQMAADAPPPAEVLVAWA